MNALRRLAGAGLACIAGTAGAASIATIELPIARAGTSSFNWQLRADGRYELRVPKKSTIRLAQALPAGTSIESSESSTARVLIVGQPADGSVVALTVQGRTLVLAQATAPTPPTLPAPLPSPAAPAASPAAPPPPAAAAPTPAPAVPGASPVQPAAAAAASSVGSARPATLVQDLLTKALKPIDGLDEYRVDFAVPTSPAFAVLGGTPELILQPKSPRDLAVSLIDGVTDSDKLGRGIGFDIAPYMLWKGRQTTLARYQGSSTLQRLANLQMSFGAMKAAPAGGEKVTRLALGLTVPLLDEADPRAKNSRLANCFGKAANDVLGLTGQHVPTWAVDELRAMKGDVGAPSGAAREAATQLSERHSACRDSFRHLTWSATRWTVGLAGSLHDRGEGTNAGTYGVWTTYSHDLTPLFQGKQKAEDEDTPRSQALLQLRRLGREEVERQDDPRGFRLRAGTQVSAGMRYGSHRRNFSIEGGVYRARYDNGERETSRKLALGGELMINKDFWLVLSVGGEGGLKDGKNKPFALAGLKFGSASEPTGVFAPKR